MSANGWLQFAIYSLVLLATVRPVGIYLARVLEGERTWLDPVLRPFERLIYKLSGVNAEQEMNWREYAFAMLGFSAVGMLRHLRHRAAAGIAALQSARPCQLSGPISPGTPPPALPPTPTGSSTRPRSTMSYLTEMAGLATHNFWSAAVGIVVAVALIRGIKRTTSGTIGNFWVDMTRTLLYMLLPGLAHLCAAAGRPGRPAEPHAYTAAHTLEQPSQTQTIGQGPVASQEAIKMLGTNGGGFFNANSAHPFENPTPFSNFLQILSIFIIPAGLTYTLGRMTGSPGHGWAVLAAMFVLFAAGFTTVYWAEVAAASAAFTALQQARTADRSRRQHGRQGSPQRHRRKRTLRHHHHRCQLRRGQRHARQLHSPRRHGRCSPTSCSAKWSSAASARACTASSSSSCCRSSSPASWWAARPSIWARRSSPTT